MAKKQNFWTFFDATDQASASSLGVADGDLCTITSTGQVQKYIGGAWLDVAGSQTSTVIIDEQTVNSSAAIVNIGDIPVSGDFITIEMQVSALVAGGTINGAGSYPQYHRLLRTMYFNAAGGTVTPMAGSNMLDVTQAAGEGSTWSADIIFSGFTMTVALSGDPVLTVNWGGFVHFKVGGGP